MFLKGAIKVNTTHISICERASSSRDQGKDNCKDNRGKEDHEGDDFVGLAGCDKQGIILLQRARARVVPKSVLEFCLIVAASTVLYFKQG